MKEPDKEQTNKNADRIEPVTYGGGWKDLIAASQKKVSIRVL